MGRKASVLGWAEANGMATPGGFVLPADGFREALECSGASGQARYLERSVLRLDPTHALDIAASVTAALGSPAVDDLAAAHAEAAFDLLGAPLVVCRSSAAMEDGRAAAFPGVFTSVLDLASPAALGAAITACWRSAFSADVIRYLLRVRAEPVDFSLALMLQRQVDAAWYGVYVSADPLTGAAEPLADLSDQGPDTLVAGGRATLRARRHDGTWTGAAELAPSLEAVHRTAARLADHVGSDVDVEFALPGPVILQCRPLAVSAPAYESGPPGQLRGRPCAPGRAAGLVGGGDGQIAVLEHLTPTDYGIVLRSAGVVTERDASPLGHVAVLCRELGVPFVCGVDGARARLRGRHVRIDGASGSIELVDHAAPSSAPRPPRAEPVLSALELLLRVLAEGRPGHAPHAEAERLVRRYGRALGSSSVEVVGHPVDPRELAGLERMCAQLFGPEFSATAFLADAEAYRRPHVPEHHPAPRPGAARHG